MLYVSVYVGEAVSAQIATAFNKTGHAREFSAQGD
jgi:hypothetical protein